MNNTNCDKMILAILQGDDYRETIEELNGHGFYATILHSSGGFLRKQSVTIMIGLNHERLEEALQVLKRHGEHTEMRYQPAPSMDGTVSPLTPAIQVPVQCGGVVLFVLDVTQHERF